MAIKFLVLFLISVYAGGVWKFWSGFNKTNFERNFANKLILALLWPVLVANKSYRQNFNRALKG